VRDCVQAISLARNAHPIKELKAGVALDRLSCSRFRANQFRLLLSTAAYILFQALRLAARGTAWPRRRSPRCASGCSGSGCGCNAPVRRIVVHFPAAFPWRGEWSHLALAVGATP
jgi:hypothetical protein